MEKYLGYFVFANWQKIILTLVVMEITYLAHYMHWPVIGALVVGVLAFCIHYAVNYSKYVASGRRFEPDIGGSTKVGFAVFVGTALLHLWYIHVVVAGLQVYLFLRICSDLSANIEKERQGTSRHYQF